MVMVQIHPQGISEEEMIAEKESVARFFQLKKEAKDCSFTVSTLLWQIHDGVSHCINDKEPMQILYGSGTVMEELHCYSNQMPITEKPFQFRISPLAFFQSNTPACERLYGLVGDWLLPPTDSKDANGSDTPSMNRRVTLLDLCCGTGTIGITLSAHPSVKRVIGVEMCEQAVRDAEVNAANNGLDGKMVYYCARVEDVLSKILKGDDVSISPDAPTNNAEKDVSDKNEPTESQDACKQKVTRQEHDCTRMDDQMQVDREDVNEVVAVLDPPRAGVHPSVIKALRKSTIKRLIYVSCNPNAASVNWADLCRPATSRLVGSPFRLVRAQAVDMFPHTEHCEMVLEFKRE
jgi:tRNA (uracil-5-)-methyltransferase